MKAITQFLLKVKLRCARFGICIWQESPHGLTQLNERKRQRGGRLGAGDRERQRSSSGLVFLQSHHSTDHITHSPSGRHSGERTGHLECSGPPCLPLSSPLSHLLTFHSGGIQAGHGRIHFLFYSLVGINACLPIHPFEEKAIPCPAGWDSLGRHSLTMQSLQGPLVTQPPVLSIRRHRTKAEQGTEGNSSGRSLRLPRSYLGMQEVHS